MKAFYALLAAVAVVGGGLMWYGAQRKAVPVPAAPAVVAPAADGFRGYTLGAATAPVEVTEYSD
ncbi:MAG TPA: hypothetical protein VFI66_04675, partial [Gemmatimonadales bacterium]|nr:hypothetical protein [Gemmatimonadales bacterium]